VRGVKDYAAFATDSTDDTATNDLLTQAEDIIEQWTLSRIHATERQDLDMANTFAQLAERDYQNLLRTNNARNAPGHNAVHSFLV
jgi:dissimilatory sulfite reductase (desulfoviridin) alpha/beta subunit